MACSITPPRPQLVGIRLSSAGYCVRADDAPRGYALQNAYSGAFYSGGLEITRRLIINARPRHEFEQPMSERYNRAVRGFDATDQSPIAAQAIANHAKNSIPQIRRATWPCHKPGALGRSRNFNPNMRYQRRSSSRSLNLLNQSPQPLTHPTQVPPAKLIPGSPSPSV
jgi:hypothetical protein